MTETYRLAKLYVNHCGFSCVPGWYGQKRLMFGGTIFQHRPPTLDDLRRWFDRNPANIAIVPGDISDNLCILDFDDFNTWAVFHALTSWPGPVVRTSRGVHVYVRVKRLPVRNGQGFFKGVHFGQIIAHGSITAPPSRHPSGHVYQWCADSPERIPYLESLEEIGVERRDTVDDVPRRVLPSASTRRALAGTIENQEAYVSAAIQRECEKILTAQAGGRNRQLYLSALKLSKYSGMLGTESLASFLESAARQAGLSNSEIRNTIRSGLTNGLRNGVI